MAAKDENLFNLMIPTLDRSTDTSYSLPFDLTKRQKTGGAEEGVGTGARNPEDNQEPCLLVVDQAGDNKRFSGTHAQSEQYLSSSPKGQRKRTKNSRSIRNTDSWTNEKIMDEFDGTNYYSTSWQRLEDNLSRRTEHDVGKNTSNRYRRMEEAKPIPKKKHY